MLDDVRRKAISDKLATIPCIRSMGFDGLELEDGIARLRAPHDASFDGIFPIFHGGMLAMVADCAAWMAIATRLGPDEPLVTTDLHIRYLAACETDAMAAARVIKVGRTLCPVTVELSDTRGGAVALAQVTYMRLSPTTIAQ